MITLKGEQVEQFKTLYNTVCSLFDGVYDKGGNPYMSHIEAVIEGASVRGYRAMLIALFHDVLEDTDTTEDDLRSWGLTRDVIHGVKLMTRDDGVSYHDYINTILESGDKDVMVVKLSDVCNNSDFSRLDKVELQTWHPLKVRYDKTRESLVGALSVSVYDDIVNAQEFYKQEMSTPVGG